MRDSRPSDGKFYVDPDITRARTLSADFYTDPENFELSKEKIFARSWQFLGHTDGGPTLQPLTLLPNVLDEPMLIARGTDGTRCMTNVCTHRGKILVEEPCGADLIRCGYHGRRFGLDGKFLSMPEFEGVVDFPSVSDDLREIDSASWLGFLFASIAPGETFTDTIGDISDLFDDIAGNVATLTHRREYEVNAHWALYCENYLEGFHIPFVHKGLNEVVSYGTYSTETFRRTSVQTGWTKGSSGCEIAGRYLFIFPNTMLNFYPWGLSVNVVRPLSPTRTSVEFLSYVSDESLLGTGAGADLHSVELEDEAVVESVQKGIRSRFYSHGRYSPTREQGTHHFHRLIAEFMTAE